MLIRLFRLGRILKYTPGAAVIAVACLYLVAVFACLATVLAGIVAQ